MRVGTSGVFVEVTRARGNGDRGDTTRFVGPADSIDPFDVLAWTDTASIGATPTFSVTLPGRTHVAGGVQRPWRELFHTGDLIRASAHNALGGPEAAVHRVVSDGLVKRVAATGNLTDRGYEATTTLVCAGLQSVLEKDAVAWWMHYGSVEGWTKAIGQLLPDDRSGRLDKVFANYFNRIVFNKAMWRRGGYTLGDRVGYHVRSLTPSVPILINISVMEGSHWSILQQHTDAPLHEFFTRVYPASFRPVGGFMHRPTVPNEPAVVRSANMPPHDGGRTWVVLRPTPFPHATPQQAGVVTEWNALPLHDLTNGPMPFGADALEASDDAVRNFFLVVPRFQGLNDEMAFTVGIGVNNRASIEEFSYSPMKIATNLVFDEKNRRNVVENAIALTWRLAGQWNRMDEMLAGNLTIPLSPQIWPGDRVRFLAPSGDRTSVMEGYVVGRTHSWSREGGGSTTLQLDRVLPQKLYGDPLFFARGLRTVQVNISATAPKARES